MRGVESIVGAYLALLLIISAILGFYTWISRSSVAINEQFNDNLEKLYYVNYPPVISLSYINESFLKLTIYPYIPLYVGEVVVKDLNGEVLDYKLVDKVITSAYEVEVRVHKTPAVITIVSKGGIVYYYVPKSDPGLLHAPEYIRDKVFVDEELINYLASKYTDKDESNSYNGEVRVALSSVGYKVFAGIVPLDKLNDVVLRGPIACGANMPNVYNCNLNVFTNYYYYVTFLTYNYNASIWWVENDATLFLKLSPLYSVITGAGHPFFQVLRLIEVKSTSSVNVTFNYNLTLTGVYSGDQGSVQISVVVYILPSYTPLDSPVVLAVPNIYGKSSTLWLDRALLAYYPPGTLPHDPYKAIYGPALGNVTITINPLNYGHEEIIVAVGMEFTAPTSSNAYVKISI